MSQIGSQISITKSAVSQVDFKLKANNVKSKLKGLLKNVDADKSGFVKHEVFFELLSLHGVKLNEKAVSYLKKSFSKNSTINYKDAVNQLTIDLVAAGGTDETGTDGALKWTVNAHQKPASKIGDDSISQVGPQEHIKSGSRAAPSVKSGGDFLSKDKLQGMEKKY